MQLLRVWVFRCHPGVSGVMSSQVIALSTRPVLWKQRPWAVETRSFVLHVLGASPTPRLEEDAAPFERVDKTVVRAIILIRQQALLFGPPLAGARFVPGIVRARQIRFRRGPLFQHCLQRICKGIRTETPHFVSASRDCTYSLPKGYRWKHRGTSTGESLTTGMTSLVLLTCVPWGLKNSESQTGLTANTRPCKSLRFL